MNELQAFEKHLRENEKSPATIEKYLCEPAPSCAGWTGVSPPKS